MVLSFVSRQLLDLPEGGKSYIFELKNWVDTEENEASITEPSIDELMRLKL